MMKQKFQTPSSPKFLEMKTLGEQKKNGRTEVSNPRPPKW